jgi:extracellular factor (EF) 3-hydroxypalmitic acid methyl ester biosynthesis protein
MSTEIIEVDNDSIIVCENSQGVSVRATLLRMTRYSASFEVYNPYSILQLSEVLNSFKIIVSGKILYSGRGIVSNLVNTGIVLVCEASLDEDNWLDVELLSPALQVERLSEEFDRLVGEWNKVEQITPELKIIVSDMQTLLSDMRRWLEQVELAVRSSSPAERVKLELTIIEKLNTLVLPTTQKLFERFEAIAGQVKAEVVGVHRAYARRQLHPLILCSPFVHRTYSKPLGYAGDHEMVNMILGDADNGSSLFAKVLNSNFVGMAPAEAHRNRVIYLTDMLGKETRRKVKLGQNNRVFNLGCGPAKEVQNFLSFDDLCDRSELYLLDFNDETLDLTGKNLADIKMKHRRTTRVQMIKRSVHQILKEGAKIGETEGGNRYDVVYCAGLFDYLSDRICRRLLEIFYEMVAPEGLLVATNVDACNPARYVMEYFMEWHLIYRNKEQFLALAPQLAPPENCQVKMDATGANIFLEVRKPASPK